MTEAEKRVHAYLAQIGRRGGLASRRELTRSHAKQMGRDPRSETRRIESWKALAASQSQRTQAFLNIASLNPS